MPSWTEEAGPSTMPAERRPLILSLRIPRSYGSLFPYYKFVRDTASETYRNEVLLFLIDFYQSDLGIQDFVGIQGEPPAGFNNICSKIYHH